MTRVQLRSQEGSSSRSHSAIMNECLLLANFAFYAEMYEGDTAYYRESSTVRNHTWLHC